MSGRLSVVPCGGRRDWKLFENIPELLHRSLPHFRPPFPGRVAGLRKPSHPFHSHGEIYPFIAYRGQEPVGRIAAIVNDTHNRLHGDRTGFFGFFDFVDDIGVARALFDTAIGRLTRAGRTPIRGPFSPTQNDECGVLVDGFAEPPYLLMPYNPRYYPGLYAALGLVPARDLRSYRFRRFDSVAERVGRVAERARARSGVTFRVADLRDRREFAVLEYLFNETLKDEWNFMPMTRRALEFSARELWPVRSRAPLIVAERDGEPVGFSLILPNLNEFLEPVRSSSGLIRLARLAYHVSTRRAACFRLAALGVLEQVRAGGVAQLLYLESARIDQAGDGEVGWIQDVNQDMNNAVRAMGLEPVKTYRIYEFRPGTEVSNVGIQKT